MRTPHRPAGSPYDQLDGSAMLARGMFRGAVAQARCCRLTPALRVATCGRAAPVQRTLHATAQLRGPEHDDFAPVSKVVPDTDILQQIDEVCTGIRQWRHPKRADVQDAMRLASPF